MTIPADDNPLRETTTGFVLEWENPTGQLRLTQVRESAGRHSAWVEVWHELETRQMGLFTLGMVPLDTTRGLVAHLPDLLKFVWTARAETAIRVLHAHFVQEDEPLMGFHDWDPETQQLEPIIAPYLWRESPTLFFGEGGHGKTWIALWLAYQSAAAGYPVLWLDWETEPRDFWSRVSAIAYGRQEAVPDGIHYHRVSKRLADVVDTAKEDVSTTGAKLVVVDSVMLACGEAQEDQAVAKYFSALRTLGTASLSIAHVAKGRKDEPFGSVFWVNLPRLVCRVQGESEDGKLTVGVTGTKANSIPWPAPTAMDFGFDLDQVEITVAPAAAIDAIASKPPTTAQKMWDLLAEPMNPADVARILNVQRNTVYVTINRHQDKFVMVGGRVGKVTQDD